MEWKVGSSQELVSDLAELWIEVIGLFAGLIGVIAWVPQIREVWFTEKHEGISLPTFGLIATALSAWLVYGVLVRSLSIIVANLAALGCISLIILGVVRLRGYG